MSCHCGRCLQDDPEEYMAKYPDAYNELNVEVVPIYGQVTMNDPIDAYVGGDEDEDSPALPVVHVVPLDSQIYYGNPHGEPHHFTRKQMAGLEPITITAFAQGNQETMTLLYGQGWDQMGVAESNPLIPEVAPMEAPPVPALPEATDPCFIYCSCEYCNNLEDEKMESKTEVAPRVFRESSRTKHMEYRIINARNEVLREFNDAQEAYSELDRMTGELHALGVFDMDPWMQDRTINVVTETNGWDLPEFAFIVQLTSTPDDDSCDCGPDGKCWLSYE